MLRFLRKRDSSESNDGHLPFIDKLRRSVPRLYYITTHLVLPLLTLIGMSFFFGWLLARFEMKGEIEKNDQAMRKAFFSYTNHSYDQIRIQQAMVNASTECLTSTVPYDVQQAIPNFNWVTSKVGECADQRGKEQFPFKNVAVHLLQTLPHLSFDWMKCYKQAAVDTFTFDELYDYYYSQYGLNPGNSNHQQLFRYIFRFTSDAFAKINEENAKKIDGDLTEEEYRANIERATGSDGCQVHTAGGALFWFTIMTTVGYGNTAPATEGGRMLVYTCGFATIVGFLILNNTAAHVWKHIFEDIFHRFKIKPLIKGPVSVLFWLCMTIFWMVVTALAMQSYKHKRIEEAFAFNDAFWFSYITITTVGFGDIHIEHEEFAAGDMFFIPLIVLMGFNFLGIFADKGVDLYNHYFPEDHCGLQEILQEERGDLPKKARTWILPADVEANENIEMASVTKSNS